MSDVPGAGAPDLIHAVIGYRQWRVHDGALWSAYADDRWQRGVNTARCGAEDDEGHGSVPGHECTCGIHAWYRPCPPLGSPATSDLVAGAVALWGDVELHVTGMRAQHAMVVALVRPVLCKSKRREVARVATALEVEAVPARRLEAVALKHGWPVPRNLRPRVVRSPVALAIENAERRSQRPAWKPSSLVSDRQPQRG